MYRTGSRNRTRAKPAAKSRSTGAPDAEELRLIDAYWRACNYLAAGMIYLQDNPLLREPLRAEHIKNRLLGHWGASPGLSFMYVHLNRLIRKYGLDAIFLAGPGHGAPGVLAPVYLEGTYSEIYPQKGEDLEGMRAFFKEFSFPGGIGSHCTPETPGSIHEGGELGYSVSHAFGAAYDNPELIVAVAVGDGESETGPLATAWHSNKFLYPVRDGAVLPILHLNGYKINNPTILARISHEELESLFRGYGWTPHFVEGDDPAAMHRRMAQVMEECVLEIRRIQPVSIKNYIADFERGKWPYLPTRAKSKTVAGNSPSTFNKLVTCLRGVFDLAVADHVIAKNPAAELTYKPLRQKLLRLPSKTQFAKIVHHIRTRAGKGRIAGDLVEGLAYSGLRVEEANTLFWEDLDHERRMVTVKGTKTAGSARIIPMTPAFFDLTLAIKSRRENASGMSVRPSEKVFEASKALMSLSSACEAVCVKKMTHHDLRHLFATTCIESGVDVPTVAGWLGHVDGGVLAMQTYGHIRPAHSVEAAKKVAFV